MNILDKIDKLIESKSEEEKEKIKTAYNLYLKSFNEVQKLLKSITTKTKNNKKRFMSDPGPFWTLVGDIENTRKELRQVNKSLKG